MSYNNKREMFPSSIIAGMANFAAATMFEVSDEEREAAASLYRTLQETEKALLVAERSYAELEAAAVRDLDEKGLRAEYFAIRQAADLKIPLPGCSDFVVLAAVHLEGVRLIDNVLVSIK